MKRTVKVASFVVLAGLLSGHAMAADRVLVKEELSPNYCHMKFPTIREETLGSKTPLLKDASTGDVIDFYGPCDETPTGTDQVIAQKLDEQRGWKD
jgi:hypothetical protein